jgi:predicted metal-dependent peptidase
MREITPEESLSKIKSQLILRYIFWATLLLKMACLFRDWCRTAYTDGDMIGINPKFWTGLDPDEQKFVLAHELGHCILKHHLRKGNRKHRLWNIACDFVVNLLLVDAGFKLPHGCLYDEKYRDMTTEAVYALLEKDKTWEDGEDGEWNFDGEGDGDGSGSSNGEGEQPSKGNGKGSGKWGWKFGEVKDYKGSDPQANDHEWSARVAQAVQASRSCGQGSAFMDRLVEANKRSRIPWKEVVQRFVQVLSKNDFDWTRPNKRYIAHDTYLPSVRSFEVGKILFIGDSSGSIGDEEINIAASEIQAACLLVKADFFVLWVDDTVHLPIEEIDPHEYPLQLKPKGGGGTDFVPGFQWVDRENFDPLCVIYITDGYCGSFPKEPDYPVLWLVTAKDKFDPPFGEVTYWHDV